MENDVTILAVVFVFGAFCFFVGVIVSEIEAGEKKARRDKKLIERVDGAFGRTSAPAQLVRKVLDDE